MSWRRGGMRSVQAVETPLVEPAFFTRPEWAWTLGPEVADLCDMVGYSPDPEQRLVLDVLFAEDKRGMPVAFETAIIAPRQNLKTGVIKQAGLGWAFLTKERLIVWSAHEFPASKEAFRDLKEIIEGSSFLSRQVKRIYAGSGAEAIELKGDRRIVFRARTRTGGRSLSGDKVILDEAFALTATQMGSLLPTLSARPRPQVVYGSSAGMAHSVILRALRNRGRLGSSARLAWIEWCSKLKGCAVEKCPHFPGTPGCEYDDEDRWQEANTLLGRTRANGTGLPVDLLRGMRQSLPPEEFAREYLGVWDEPGVSDLFGVGKWEAGEITEHPSYLPVDGLGVAVSVDLRRSAIVAAALDPTTGLIYGKPLVVGPGMDWVVRESLALRESLPGRPRIGLDSGGPAGVLIPKFVAAGCDDLVELTMTDYLDSCAGLWEKVDRGVFLHGHYEPLEDAVNGATTRDVRDRWAWARRGESDITPLEAMAIAVWLADQPGDEVPDESVYEERGVLVF